MADSKRSSYIDEEKIEVKPSIELIPDEYEHLQESQSKIIVHTFVSNYEEDRRNEDNFLKTVKNFEYVTVRHNLDKDDFSKCIQEIVKGSTAKDAGLILFFSGCLDERGYLKIFDGKKQSVVDIQQIWTRFTSHNCPNLKNKPKIFIFALSNPTVQVQTDSRKRYGAVKHSYDTPAEADILVVCNKSEAGESYVFIEQFCENIKDYGHTENIITLASCVFSPVTTLIVSTLTRNFYFTFSNLRGHHHIIQKHTDEIKNHVKEMKETLDKKFSEKKEKRSWFGSFRIGKNKTEDEKPQGSTTTASTASSITINAKPQFSAILPRKTSLGYTRPRLISQSESDSGRTSIRRPSEKNSKVDRPIWRP